MKSNINISKKKLKTLHYVYITYCTLTGEFYFGKRSTDDKINDPYLGSGKELNKLIREFGREHFKREWVARFDTEQEAYDHEEDLIRHFISDIKCLNKTINAGGGKSNYGTYKYPNGKIAKLHVNDPDVLSGLAVHINKGILRSESARLAISKGKKGKPAHNKGKPNPNKGKKYKLKENKPKENKPKENKIVHKKILYNSKYTQNETDIIFSLFFSQLKTYNETAEIFNEKFRKPEDHVSVRSIKNHIKRTLALF